jgi:hypothetical protein
MNDERRETLRVRAICWSGIALCVLLALWVVFAKLLVPSLIESAYRGESLSFLNRMIRGQAAFPVEHYLRLWDMAIPRVTIALAGFGLAGVIMLAITSSRAFFQRYVGPATPGSLGALRMLTCSVLLLITALEDLSSIAMLPPETRAPQGVMRFLYALPLGLDRLVASATGLWIFQLLTEVILFLGVLGWHTRIVIPLGTVCHFLIGGILRDYSFDWHQGWVPLYLMVILSFTPCGDGWSVDRLRRVHGGRPVPDADSPSAVYGWARYLCWAAIALPYVQAGLAKLRYGGLFWWSPSNMRSILYEESLRPREFDWQLSLHLVPAPDIIFSLLGLAGLLGEVSFGLVLFSRRARRILPIVIAGMHIGILVLQRILFVDLILLQAAFFDWAEMRRRLGTAIYRHLGSRRASVQAGTSRASAEAIARAGAAGIEPSAHRLRFPLILSGWAVVSMLCWFFLVEYYPLTSWHLFRYANTTGKIAYYKVLARFESGERAPFRLEDGIGAMAYDSRYEPFLAMCFGRSHHRHPSPEAEDAHVCRKFLAASAAAYNRRARPDARVTQLEIQAWEWDWGSTPSDPEYGRLVDRFVLDLDR